MAAETGTDGGGDRAFVGAGKNGDFAILLDAHGHLGTDQIEAFGAQMAAQKAEPGNADLGFRRARHDRPVGVAHNDVADAHRGAAVFRALDLGSADRDVMIAAEILLDGGSKPGRRNVELNGSARKPPPQSQEARERRAQQTTPIPIAERRIHSLVTGQQCQQQPKARERAGHRWRGAAVGRRQNATGRRR